MPGEEVLAFEIATRDLVGLALRSVEKANVSLPQFRLLLVLDELGEVSSTRCARALGVAGSSVTRMADRLHSSGYLVRGVDPDNRSVVTLALTAAGRRVVRQVSAWRRRELSAALDRLDPVQRRVCAEALAQLHETLGAGGVDDPAPRLPL